MGCARRAAIATTVILAAPVMAAPADARTYRFAPAQEVEVSFELHRPKPAGTLVRFARNRLALRGRRPGRLTLSARGASARSVSLPRRRAVRIRVVLSAAGAAATLSAGGRTTTANARVVAEDAVRVRSGRGIRAVRVRPTSAPSTGQAPSPAPEPSPASAPAPAAARLFAPDSVWNTPVPADAPLDPAGAELVEKLSDTVWGGFAAGRSSWIQENDGSTPLYIVPADQPTMRVTLDTGAWATSLQQAFEQVPIPPGAKPAAGSDAHMTIWQPATDHMWEFFDAEQRSDGWHASFGGAISSVSRFPGYYSDSAWPGLSHWYWGATATSLPVIAGTMLIDELEAGVVPHALALNIPYARPKIYSWPAQRTDGTSTDPAAIPEGAHFRLDPTLDLSKLDLPRMTRIMAEAAQQYGMIVRDQTGWAVALFAEDATPTGTSPYGGADGFYGGHLPSDLMKAFPWDHLQLLRMDLHG